MKILVDIGHPAHVHLFKNFAKEMISNGHQVLFTCRDKEFEIALLKDNGFDYVSFGQKYKSLWGKIYGLVKFDLKEYSVARRFRPDIFISHGSMYAAHAAWLLGKPHIAMEDTYNFEQIKLYLPVSDVILTADYENPLTQHHKNISYSGYHALAYLHPKRFTPDKSVLKELGLTEDEKFVLIRFVAWKATHDMGYSGLSLENKIDVVKQLSQYSKVFISSEGELPKELEPYKITISPSKIHDVISFVSIVLGESTTMAEEAAMLATPAVLIGNNHIIYTKNLEEEYHLIFNLPNSDEGLKKGVEICIEILKQSKSRVDNEWIEKRDKMLRAKIDVTAFMVWFVENYPKSKKIMKENPDYQYRFK